MKTGRWPYLYRYQSMPNDNSSDYPERIARVEKVLSHSELYFPSPKTFNDPFDCKVDFTFDGCSDDDIRQYLERALKELHRESEISKNIEYALNNKHLWQQNARNKAVDILQPETDSMGVVCLSEHRDDILMWSHYSDGHKGFCLEFDKERLKAWKFCQPVDYDQKYLSFKEFNDVLPDNSRSIQLLFRKSKHWKYEAEWRLIVRPDENNPINRLYKFPEELLTGVIFGCLMPDDKKNIIKDFLKNRKSPVQLYVAKKKENEFALRIEPIG
ncbi:MAG: DUF2971 domain-containing protein [Thermodesulfovibrionales bacterium]